MNKRKDIRFLSAIMIALALVFGAASMVSASETELQDVNNESIVKKVVVSAIDGFPFIAYFDPTSGRVSSFDMNGISMGYRYVENEEAFLELIAINYEMTRQSLEQRTNRERRNINVTMIDHDTGTLIEYDAHGNRTETILEKRTDNNYIGVIPFGVFHGTHNVPSIMMPARLNSTRFLGNYFHTQRYHTNAELRTYNFPNGMRTIDVIISNHWGDCWTQFLDVNPNRSAIHSIRFPGERYAAYISTWYVGNWRNVPFTFQFWFTW